MVFQGGFLPSTTFLPSTKTNNFEGSQNETSKQITYKNSKVISKKFPKYKVEPPGTNASDEIKDTTVNGTPPSSKESDYEQPDKSKVNDNEKPKVSVYSRPLLPLPKDFGFRLSELLDLEQRVTEANFPTISTFTDNFEADIDWTRGER